MAFTPRFTVPSAADREYTITSYGGLNECVAGRPAAWTGSALANCVGYTWGRAYEVLGSRPALSRGNGGTWYGYNDGYSRGQTPRLGAIACWSGGVGNAGHVAFVESIQNNTIITSNSAYDNTIFYLQNYTIGNYAMAGYTFQGFIYLPISEGTKKKMSTFTFGSLTKLEIDFEKEKVDIYYNDDIKVGDDVKVVKPIIYGTNNTFNVLYDSYKVVELAGNRAVIAAGGVVQAAIDVKNLEKI